jgi:hypothetical protein
MSVKPRFDNFQFEREKKRVLKSFSVRCLMSYNKPKITIFYFSVFLDGGLFFFFGFFLKKNIALDQKENGK